MRQMLLLLAVILTAGCGGSFSTQCPAQNMEITVIHVRPDCVRAAMTTMLINQGYILRSTSDTQIVAGKATEYSKSTRWLKRLLYDNPPEKRVTLLFIPVDSMDNVRIVWNAEYVYEANTATEEVEPIASTPEDESQFMAMLPLIEKNCHQPSN